MVIFGRCLDVVERTVQAHKPNEISEIRHIIFSKGQDHLEIIMKNGDVFKVTARKMRRKHGLHEQHRPYDGRRSKRTTA